MSYWLGIDVGNTYTAAAICRDGAGRRGLPEVVALGSRANAVSSVVYLGDDGQVVVGEAAERRAVTDPERVVRGFKRRIGDDVPMIIGGKPHSAPGIAAMIIRWVVDRVAEREGATPAGIVITHPAGWGRYKVQIVADALRAAGQPDTVFRTEPEAAAASYASQERVRTGSTIAVYDFGGGTFDVAVVRKRSATAFSVLGIPQGIEHLGGIDFDDAIFDHVVAAVPALRDLDPDDPAALAATAALRRQCTEAKEALSVDTEVAIPVLAPGVQSQVRLVRSEFEEMIRPKVAETVEALRRALRSADLSPSELDAVLLVGGSSRVPLVAQLVSAELGRPVAVDADPKAAIALGAALSAVPTEVAEAADTGMEPAVVAPDGPAFDRAEPEPSQVPQRPSLSAIPLDVQAVPSRWQRIRTRRSSQVAAGLVALALAGTGVSVLMLTSAPSPAAPTTPAPGGAPAPAVSVPATPAPDTGGGSQPDVASGSSPGNARPAVAPAPKRASESIAHPAAPAVPAPLTTPAAPAGATTSRSAPPSPPPSQPTPPPSASPPATPPTHPTSPPPTSSKSAP